MKQFFLGCGGTLTAIALLISPAYSEEQSTTTQNSESLPPELVPFFSSSDALVSDAVSSEFREAQSTAETEPAQITSTQDFSSTQSFQAADLSLKSAQSSTEAVPPSRPVAQAEAPVAESFAKPAPSDRWQFSVEPYFFVPLNVRADVTAAGRSASARAGLGEVLNLDRAFDIGMRLEARKDKFAILLDGFYLSAGQSGSLGVTFPQGSLQNLGINTAVRVNADAEVSVRQGTIDLAAAYRVVDTVLGNSEKSASSYPRLVIDPILGLRTNIFKQELEVSTIRLGNATLPVNREFSVSRTTVEPLIGARIGLDLSERWTVGIRGDVSGFNLNADRDITWNFLIGARYRLSPTTSLQLAYTLNNFLFEDGEGLTRARLNLRQEGLWLSVLFQF